MKKSLFTTFLTLMLSFYAQAVELKDLAGTFNLEHPELQGSDITLNLKATGEAHLSLSSLAKCPGSAKILKDLSVPILAMEFDNCGVADLYLYINLKGVNNFKHFSTDSLHEGSELSEKELETELKWPEYWKRITLTRKEHAISSSPL